MTADSQNSSFAPEYYFDLSKTEHAALFDGLEYVWDGLKQLSDYLESILKPGIEGDVHPAAVIEGDVYIGPGTVVEPGAYINGPAWIGRDCTVRKGAYLRGNVIAGDGSVLGNACEFKHCALLGAGNVPHFAYVGDSILGTGAHLGAGVKISNVKLIRTNVTVAGADGPIDTGLIKFGAALGDHCDVGCNSVLNPGSLLGRETVVYPNSSWRGFLPSRHIVKMRQTQEVVERR
ncbi:UDP-N-acetylglucosamine diphosphorylase [candidate division KSB1 bacterium]